jgi:hypothetical protein
MKQFSKPRIFLFIALLLSISVGLLAQARAQNPIVIHSQIAFLEIPHSNSLPLQSSESERHHVAGSHLSRWKAWSPGPVALEPFANNRLRFSSKSNFAFIPLSPAKNIFHPPA